MNTRSVPGETGDLEYGRRQIRDLLAPRDPADATTAYYALYHPEKRVRLTLHHSDSGQVVGFLAVCQTGRDLFVPLVVMRAPEDAVADLCRRALVPGRPYLFIVPPALRRAVESALDMGPGHRNAIYVLDASAFRPVLNVMVQPGQAAYRYEIRVQERVVAAAGVNWYTASLADLYVYTADDYQGRGWGRAVGAACIQRLLAEGVLPLYRLAEDSALSPVLARALGFEDSGAREFECLGSLRSEREARTR